jgi:hypothetical protein
MSGSMSWFDYKTDVGTNFAVKMDTSNGVAVGNTPAAAGTDTLPKYVTPRYFMYQDATGLRKRKIVVSDPLTFAAPPVTIALGAETGPIEFKFIYSRGEKASRSRVNTGILV